MPCLGCDRSFVRTSDRVTQSQLACNRNFRRRPVSRLGRWSSSELRYKYITYSPLRSDDHGASALDRGYTPVPRPRPNNPPRLFALLYYHAKPKVVSTNSPSGRQRAVPRRLSASLVSGRSSCIMHHRATEPRALVFGVGLIPYARARYMSRRGCLLGRRANSH